MKKKQRILVAALNWGLGHASRCIPIIRRLLARDIEVVMASDGEALQLLRAEFPDCSALTLPSYNISYKTQNMVRNIAPQVPHLLRTINLERKSIRNIIKKYQIDAIISDNRYGVYLADIHCVFLTHQLRIPMPYTWLEWLFAQLNDRYIKKFGICWVPDFQQEPSLAGRLSHKTKLSKLKYIGPLSRMKPLDMPKKYDLLIILSGPEPQRSFFEQIILKQLQELDLRNVILVRGKTLDNVPLPSLTSKTTLEIHDYLTSHLLNEKITESHIILSRSGYSSLMDYISIGNVKSILVPTPGQTEQVYLAQRFEAQEYCVYQEQKDFDLELALAKVQKISGFPNLLFKEDLLDTAIEDLLSELV
ncbi:MAG: glycosyl transferase family 28 [Saprospiraceae bacterium]|nr:glycosyl transferase family 28 [Saprospiraceae bacterium]